MKKLLHLAVDSLVSPSTVAYFLTQSSHCPPTLSPLPPHVAISLACPHSPSPGHCLVSVHWFSCLIQLFSSVPLNTLVWLQLFRNGGSSSHQVSRQCSAVVAASSVLHTTLVSLRVFFSSLNQCRKALFSLCRNPSEAAGKFDVCERKWLVGILQTPWHLPVHRKGTIEAKWKKWPGTVWLWRQTQWAEQLHPDRRMLCLAFHPEELRFLLGFKYSEKPLKTLQL